MKYTTIHHVNPTVARDVRLALMLGEVDPNETTIERFYAPAETVMGTADPSEAYRHGQGETVNQEQNGRHMVHSTMAGDILECVDGDETQWVRVDAIGFTELTIDGQPDNSGSMPHTEPLLV